MRSSFRPALLLMAGRSLGFLVTFFIPVVLARLFTRAEFGTYKQVFLVYATFYGVAQIGMAESLFYFLPSDPKRGGRLAANSILMLGVSGLGCLAILFWGGGAIGRAMNNPGLAGYLLPAGVYLVLTMMAAVLEIAMITRRQHALAAASYAVSESARALFFLAPVLIFRQLSWLLYGAVAFSIVRIAATLCYLRRIHGKALRPDAAQLRAQLRYALPFAFAVLIETIHTNLHQYIVSFRYDAATFAVYSVGILQIPIVDFLATPASSVMMVSMSECLRERRPGGVLELWHDTTRKLALVFFPLAGLLMVAAPEIIRLLFTARYAASVPLFAVWSITILFAAFQVDGVLRVYAATRTLLLLHALRLVAVGALIALLLPVFQLMGAVAATAAAAFIARGMGLLVVRKLVGTTLSALLPWRSLAGILAASATAAALALAVRAWLPLPALPRLAVAGAAFASCYVLLLFRAGILRIEERLTLTSGTGALVPSLKAGQTETQ